MDRGLPIQHPARMPAPAGVNWRKVVGVGLLVIPAVLLALVAVGEMAGGDITGIQHIPEAALLFGLAAIAWLYPRGTGMAVIAITAALFIAWLALVSTTDFNTGGAEASVWVLVGVVLFGVPMAAGWLLLFAERPQRTGR